MHFTYLQQKWIVRYFCRTIINFFMQLRRELLYWKNWINWRVRDHIIKEIKLLLHLLNLLPPGDLFPFQKCVYLWKQTLYVVQFRSQVKLANKSFISFLLLAHSPNIYFWFILLGLWIFLSSALMFSEIWDNEILAIRGNDNLTIALSSSASDYFFNVSVQADMWLNWQT